MKQIADYNIFIELGFDAAEAEVLHMRSTLMIDLRLFIEENGLTQVEAARKLGISQARVSDLVRGKWQKFNLEMLIKLEGRIGKSIQLAVSP